MRYENEFTQVLQPVRMLVICNAPAVNRMMSHTGLQAR